MNLLKASHTAFGLILVIFASYSYFMAYLVWPSSEEAIAKAGSFGDTFGVLTSLFSGLAFAGLILTVLLQRQELRESRDIFKKQKFEDAFYRLLDFHQRNLNAISIKQEESTSSETALQPGIDTLNRLLKKLTTATESHLFYLKNKNTAALYEQQLFMNIQSILTPQARYLGTLENLFLLIENELEDPSERKLYWKIIISQLTSIEKKYIFFQCLVAPPKNLIRELIHRSGFFSDLFSGAHLKTRHHKLYEKMHGIKYLKPHLYSAKPYSQAEINEIRIKHGDTIRNLRKKERKKQSNTQEQLENSGDDA